ncbi:MAG: hypothetical protein MI724_04035, partial [Spirochaetales bacterium]|nr:hypothetical protein [Spirochaetales bacterium]
GVWEPTDFWPESIVSTLAHEFQHMIQFYQREVVAGLGAEYSVWLNELSSEVTEDLVSRRLGTSGPRGVDSSDGTAGSARNTSGRMPIYNEYGVATSLVIWNSSLADYSASYAFGAFLLRTFGAELFHILLTDTPAGSGGVAAYTVSSLTRAASQMAGQTMSMEELLRRWGVAVAVSDDTVVPAGYRLNRNGFFTTTGGGAAYDVGSIDAYRYSFFLNTSDGPQRYDGPAWYRTDLGAISVAATANAFMYAGVIPQGGLNLNFSLPQDVEVTILVWD